MFEWHLLKPQNPIFVIPASEPESIEQCLLYVLEPLCNGYRIGPGTTDGSFGA